MKLLEGKKENKIFYQREQSHPPGPGAGTQEGDGRGGRDHAGHPADALPLNILHRDPLHHQHGAGLGQTKPQTLRPPRHHLGLHVDDEHLLLPADADHQRQPGEILPLGV